MSISLEQASPLVGSQFVVHTEQGPVALTLASATERPRHGLPAQFRTPLSLIFHGPASAQLGQGLFSFDHPALGRQHWMLVPVFADGAGPSAAGPAAHYEVLLA